MHTYISNQLRQFLIIGNLKRPFLKQNAAVYFKDYKNFSKEAIKTEISELNRLFIISVLEKHTNKGT